MLNCYFVSWLLVSVCVHVQVFDYSNVMKNIGFTNHYPVQEMACSAKLR